jgi:hypothetical protein
MLQQGKPPFIFCKIHYLSRMKQQYTSIVKAVAIMLMIALAMSACTTSKHVTSAKLNIDSTAIKAEARVRDSMVHVQEVIIESYNKMISDLTTSGVTFEDCPPCMDRDSVLSLLDSAGRTRYLLIEQEAKIRDLTRKVKINADGSLEAEGRIKSAMMSKSRTENELRAMERRNDSLWRVNDSLATRLETTLQVSQTEKSRTVKRFPWVPWSVALIFALLYGRERYIRWRANQKIKAAIAREIAK